MLKGIFVGYHQASDDSWSKDLLVAFWDNALFEHVSTCKACPSRKDCAQAGESQCVFPLAEATLMHPGSDRHRKALLVARTT